MACQAGCVHRILLTCVCAGAALAQTVETGLIEAAVQGVRAARLQGRYAEADRPADCGAEATGRHAVSGRRLPALGRLGRHASLRLMPGSGMAPVAGHWVFGAGYAG